MDDQPRSMNEETRELWEAKAAYWDEHVGEGGNMFHRAMVGPATKRLLGVKPGQRILEIACGNGVMTRRLAALGAEVVATDFSETFLERARSYSTEHDERISYKPADATDEAQLLALAEGTSYDAAVCNMGLMDMAAVTPLFRALTKLLKPGSPFVFSVQHPCFNSNAMTMVAEMSGDERLYTHYSVKLSDYLDVPPGKGAGTADEPNPHYYFHRPLNELFGECFEAGFVMDGLEEPRVGGGPTGRETTLTWRRLQGIPPVLVVRMKLP